MNPHKNLISSCSQYARLQLRDCDLHELHDITPFVHHASGKPCAERAGRLPARLTGLRAWRWAAATLASRTMHLPGDAAGALVPFADLHNHRPSPGPEPPPVGVPAAVCQAWSWAGVLLGCVACVLVDWREMRMPLGCLWPRAS